MIIMPECPFTTLCLNLIVMLSYIICLSQYVAMQLLLVNIEFSSLELHFLKTILASYDSTDKWQHNASFDYFLIIIVTLLIILSLEKHLSDKQIQKMNEHQ